MLVRNNQTLEEISEIVGLDLNALRELKRVFDGMDVRSHPFFCFKILKNLIKYSLYEKKIRVLTYCTVLFLNH